MISLPASLDDASFEQVFQALSQTAPDDKILLDARHTRWATPYGLTVLLTLAQTRAVKPELVPPEAEDVVSYWGRTGFFAHAEKLFDIRKPVPKSRPGAESHVLLEVTEISKVDDIHTVVGRIQERAQKILSSELNIDGAASIRFVTTLSEVCQNVVEHAEKSGWVAVQTYQWKKRLQGRRVVQIAVSDGGMGFRRSLEKLDGREPPEPGDRWDDSVALEEAVFRGVSRFRDRGRGQGLANARNFLGKWSGKLSIRSGTARIAIVPSWDEDGALARGLPYFPGAQVLITIPERIGDDTNH
jgi:anti-sigma regulatory factor (Ser/Thr protein kinase)